MVRAKATGYNGIVFSNGWSNNSIENLAGASTGYTVKLVTLYNMASQLGLEFYPMIRTIMPGQQILQYDPNMAEVFPVYNTLYVVQDGQANLVSDPAVGFPGGDFENSTGNVFEGWDGQDSPGYITFADNSVKHSGDQSLRIQTTSGEIGRVYLTLNVSPFRQYHVSMWMKTQGVTNTNGSEPYVAGTVTNRRLYFPESIMNATQDWTKYDFTFNSFDNSQVNISLGSWGAGGTMWVDDASIEELGATNIVRRNDTPLVVMSTNGTVYTEGVDYQVLTDPLLSSFQIYHPSPSIVLTDNSSITDGEQLRVSFYYAALIPNCDFNSGFAAVTLDDPDVLSMRDDEMTRLNDLLHPPGIFENYDEIRVGNWEQRSTPMTEGQMLANNIQSDKQQFKSLNSSASFFVWSDMFDPYHNAHDDYYLTNGTVDGSYNGLTSDMTVVNWDFFSNRTDSLKFFSNNGNPQILAGYYDGDAPPESQWLNEARAVNANVVGVMYTTWTGNYNGLESFAQDAWGRT